jgi:hypothetical protein
MDGSEILHNKIQEAIYYNPRYIGLPTKYLIGKSMEAGLILGGETIVVPDVRYDYQNGRAYTYFIEIKSSNSKTCRNKGHTQIKKIIDWSYRRNINTKIFLVYPRRRTRNFKRILEDLVVEEYKGNW